MKKTAIIILSLFILATVLSGCYKADNSKILKSFEGITADQVNRIEFINTTITSDKNESGRNKMAYKSQDIEKILNYLKSIKVSEYNKEIRNPDFNIGIIDNNDKEKH